MSKSKGPQADLEPRTVPAMIGEGRGQSLDRESAQSIADASVAAGFPVPPQAQAALEAASEPTEQPAEQPAPNPEA